jgi:hypothetical protein
MIKIEELKKEGPRILKYMTRLLKNPENWTKGNYAKNKRGVGVPIRDPGACQFCLVGAMSRAVYELKITDDPTYEFELKVQIKRHLSKIALPNRPFESPASFNDDPFTEHKDIVNLMKVAQKTPLEIV